MPTPAATNAMTKITLSFMLSLLGDKNFQGPDAPVNSKYHWAYKGPEGPDVWAQHYKYCAGERQSPIDIRTASCEYDSNLEPIILEAFDTTSEQRGPCVLNVTNNGHAAAVRVLSQDMRIRGGGLGQTYKTFDFHFHWGSTDDVGSEHAVDGRKYPLEMHVVNFAEKYGNIKQAMTQPDGLAVLGIFFELSEKENSDFATLDEALRHVYKAGEHTTVNHLRLRSLLPSDLSRYWRYNGSLTTPFCFESVIWTMFAEPMKISKSQLETLRSLLHEEGHDINDRGEHRSNSPSKLMDNWRPLQPLNGRIVKRSFRDPVPDKQMMDAKTESFSVPGAPHYNDPATVVGSVSFGSDSVAQSGVSRLLSAQNSVISAQPANSHVTEPKDKMESRIAVTSSLSGQQPTAVDHMTDKYVIYGVVPSDPLTSSTTVPRILQQGNSNVGAQPIDNSKSTLFRQIQQSNPTTSGLQSSKHQESSTGQVSSDSAARATGSLQTDFNPSNQQRQSITSIRDASVETGSSTQLTSNLAAPRVQLQQSERSQNMQFSSSQRVEAPAKSQLNIQTPQNVQTSQNSQASQNSQSSQNNRQQNIQISQQGVATSRLRPMDNRIAELANQIRMYRLQNQPNRPQLNTRTDQRRLLSPPVVRHNQAPQRPSQTQQGQMYAPSQQQVAFQQQRQQQPVNMNRAPSPQQLRAILERLAASRRVNHRQTVINSGAATIPQGLRKSANSLGSSDTNPPNSGSNRLPDGRVVSNNQNYNNPFLPASTNSASGRSWTNPQTNSGLNRFSGSRQTLSSQPHWPQNVQQELQMYTQQDPYQQYVYPQYDLYQQQLYGQHDLYQQQMPAQQYQYMQNPSGLDNNQAQVGTAPETASEIMTVQPLPGAEAGVPHVFLNNMQQPIRIRRPAQEQVNPWQQPQYQNPPFQFFF